MAVCDQVECQECVGEGGGGLVSESVAAGVDCVVGWGFEGWQGGTGYVDGGQVLCGGEDCGVAFWEGLGIGGSFWGVCG